MMSRWPSRRQRDDAGSMIVVLMVIMVIVTLSTVLLALVIGNQEVVASRQAGYSGVTNADAGLSDALFRLDQPGTSDIPSSGVMCLNALEPVDASCNIQSPSAPTQLKGISYVARTVPSGTAPSAATEWIVQAIGNASTGMHGAVQETLTRSTLYQFALFGKKSLTFNGNTTKSNFGAYTPGGSGSFNYCPSTATTPACVAIGSDGSVTCSGQSPASVEGIYYNAGSGGGTDTCGTPQSENTTYNVPDPTVPPTPTGITWGCPNGGNLGSGASPPYPTISPGVYVCTSEVTVTGTLQVSPNTSPVQLYIMIPSASNSPTSTFLNVAADSQINDTIPYSQLAPPGTGPGAADTLPQSDLFQVFTNSVGNLDVNGNHGFVFGGILYAPDATLTANGCKSYFFGSVNINTYTCNGGPGLGFYYDSSLAQDFGPWQISGYQQINPSSVHIPS